MNSFEYANPRTLEDAIGLLSSQWGETEILAGGTDLVTSLKQNITSPKRVVSLSHVAGLKGIETDGSEVRVGAMTALAEFIEHKDVQTHFPALVTAVEGVSSPQIIVQGTVGGDLCQRPRCWYYRLGHGLLAQHNGKSLVRDGDNRYHAIFGNGGPAYFVNPSSLAPGLIALGARLRLEGPNQATREIAVADFFRTPTSEGERENVLQSDEVLTHITIPISGLRNATYEVRQRQGLDWPLVTASVAFQLGGGKTTDARIVLGHVAPVPWVSSKAAQAIDGQALTEAAAATCGEAAAAGANPLSRNGYKVQLVKVSVKRAVLSAGGKKTEA